MVEDYFDEPVAARYDESLGDMATAAAIEPAVAMLAELAGTGRALEFGIGTGRLALPLAARGVAVHGIDLSSAMLAQLAAKAGGEAIPVTTGSFAEVTVPGRFSLVYLAFNTIMNLTSQDTQVACFGNAAAHLQPGGYFVVEVMVPELQRLLPGETYRPFAIGPDRLGFDEYDVVDQGLISHHYFRPDDPNQPGLQARSIPFRYAWPAELDLMARLAGMSLRNRWAGWDRSTFDALSRQHVSVWQLTG